jgi:2-dehydro-3-deoxyphosphogluconate aldolase/(4S)-4-hydroxy-2-oxoglutarate aldolase
VPIIVTFDRLRDAGILPVVELPDDVDVVELTDALGEGGLSCIEITLRTTGALGAIRAIRASRPAVFVAAGTVLTVEQADAAIDAGAELIVAPGYSAPVVDRAVARGVGVMPGVCTPTEIEIGLARGLRTFKFFPAEAAGGVRYLSALAGPYPSVRFVPTGGLDATNLESYVRLPNVLACGGSWMVSRRLLAERNFATVSRLAAEATEIVRRGRASVAVEEPVDR